MKFSTPHAPVPDVDARTAILLVNSGQMETRAWRHVLGMTKVPLATQVMISIVAAQNYSHAGTGRTMQLYEAAEKWLCRSRSAVERLARKLENVFIVQRQSEDQGNVHHWHLKGPEIRDALAQLAELKLVIGRVVALQAENPDDPYIGRELLPTGVYFNIVANRHARETAIQAAAE
ncbi:hypothetical protein V5F53_20710 [Xanthobacter sp. V4C-4]|uniref:hypothetical protein n=1 Tax=Xanthobacter cornucopiae TaxID=3119924 RepID=UPI0037272C6B